MIDKIICYFWGHLYLPSNLKCLSCGTHIKKARTLKRIKY